MNEREAIDYGREELIRNGIDPEPETVFYDKIGEHEAPEGTENVYRAAYAIQSIGRILIGNLTESGIGLTAARPLSGCAYEGLLHAVELLSSKIQDELIWLKEHPRRTLR